MKLTVLDSGSGSLTLQRCLGRVPYTSPWPCSRRTNEDVGSRGDHLIRSSMNVVVRPAGYHGQGQCEFQCSWIALLAVPVKKLAPEGIVLR